ncbi:MAG: hypothetical protein M0030_13185 [Actinomycetota bacterium]|nr:hypothetical protein [Actinomycetota bacterium]
MGLRWWLLAGAVAATAGLAIAYLATSRTSSPKLASHAAQISPAASVAEFAYLAAQDSNHCGLQAGEIMKMRPGVMLQGSCCDPMNLASFQYQVTALRRYSVLPAIPPDPYSISAGLARRLIGDERSIALSGGEQKTFRQAISMTADKAPCCCHCWRWDMTTGLARYLISARHWDSRQVAEVVDLVHGCGGQYERGSYPASQ